MKWPWLEDFVQSYKVSKDNPEEELKELKERLSSVPVSLYGLMEEMRCVYEDADFHEIQSLAELHETESRLILLDDLVSHDEADEICQNLVMPYIVIYVNTAPLSDSFYHDIKTRLGDLIKPIKKDKSNARVLSNPECHHVAIVYERNNKTQYVEMIFGNEPL